MSLPVASWVGRELSSGRYRVVGELGEGGMGQVYRAWDANLETDVVIKVPHAGLSDDPEFAGRFTREIRSLVKLSHPHIVKVIDVGEHNDRPFAVMQYLSGGSLADQRQLDQGGQPLPLAPQSLRPWLPDIAAALDFVHDRGYVHRDVKPANILFDEHGHAYLSDFGIAKVVLNAAREVEATSQTSTGLVLGTPHYMSPELIMGEEFDGRADQYALAVLVYELLCGQLPIDGPTPAAILVQQINHEPSAPKSIVSELPSPVSAAIVRALSKDPGLRYASCAEFAQAVLLPPQRVSGSTLPQHQSEKLARKSSQASIPCPSCGTTLVVLRQHAGRKVSCPRCKTRFRVLENLRGVQKLADKQTHIANSNKALVEPPTVMVSSLSDQVKSDTDARRTTLETAPHPQLDRVESRSNPPAPKIEASEDRWGSYARRRSFGTKLQSKSFLIVGGLAVVGILALVLSMNSASSDPASYQTSLRQANEDAAKTGQVPDSSLEVRPEAAQQHPQVSGNIKVPFGEDSEGTAEKSSTSTPAPSPSLGDSSADIAASDMGHSPDGNAGAHSSGGPWENSLPVSPPIDPSANERSEGATVLHEPISLTVEPEVELPASELVNENSTGGPVRLGTIPESVLGQLQIELDTRYVDLNGGHNYEVKRATDSARRWEIILAKLDGVGLPAPPPGGHKVDYESPIAFLEASDGELRFSWNSQNPWAFGTDQDKNLAGQLSNCVLLLRHAEEQHAIRLRCLERTAPLLVKLEEKEEETQHSLHHLPPRKSLALKLTELDGFGAVIEMVPGDGRMELDDRGRVELYVGDQKEIRLRVESELVDDGVRVSLSSHFKSGDSYKPLTPKLAKQELTLKQRLLAKGEGDLAAAKQDFKGADSYRKRLGSPPSDPRKQFAWQKQVGDANSAMKRAEGKITRNTNMIASLQEVVAALEKMGDLATALQKNSPSISYLIITTIDGNERPLLVAGRDYSQSTAASFSNAESPKGFSEPPGSNSVFLAHHLAPLENLLLSPKKDWSRGYYFIEAADVTPAREVVY